MTLQQLRAFLAIVEHGSFRRAAEALGSSQAGLTGSVQALEGGLGAALFQRSAQGARLTAEGERLLPRARLIDSEARRALEEAQQGMARREQLLRVGLGPTPTAALLRLVVPDFHARFPAVRLSLVEGFFDQLLEPLQQGQIELAITAVPEKGVGPGFKSSVLFESELVVVGRAGHPCSGASSLHELGTQEWILLGTPGDPGGTVTRFHLEQGLPAPRVAASCESFTQLSALLAGSDWLAMVPSVMVEQGLLGSHVQAIALRERAPGFDNCLIHRSESPLTPPAAAFAAMFASCARVVMRRAPADSAAP
jgi:LysR family transcriptional regulator, regulator of abg operon